MRPDEEANQADIERDQRFRGNVGRALGTAASIGIGGAASRVIPFLSNFIPTDLAMKGISKVNPKLGNFLQRGQSMGLDVKEGIQYIKDSISPNQSLKEEKNIIQKYSPELHEFIKEKIGGGIGLIAAATQANTDPKFRSVIEKMVKENKTSWPELVDLIYGTPQKEQQQPNQQITLPEEASRSPQQGQAGPGQQALMGILSKINQKLGQ